MKVTMTFSTSVEFQDDLYSSGNLTGIKCKRDNFFAFYCKTVQVKSVRALEKSRNELVQKKIVNFRKKNQGCLIINYSIKHLLFR